MTYRFLLLGSCVAALSTALACGDTSSTDTSTQADGGAQAADSGDAGAPLGDAAGSTTDGGTDAPTRTGTTCGLALEGTKWPSSCQSWMDQNCCAEEQACASDAECKALVDCINACPLPVQDSCINACSADASAATVDHFSAVGDCSKKTPPDGGADIPDECAWPR